MQIFRKKSLAVTMFLVAGTGFAWSQAPLAPEPVSGPVEATAYVEQLNDPSEQQQMDAEAQFLASAVRESRMISAEFVASTLSQLNVTQRSVDIFGGQTRTAEDPLVPNMNALEEESEIEQRNQMLEAIKNLQVVGVSPEQQEFYVGNWTVRAGEIVTLRFNDRIYNIEVTKVSAHQISFVDLETKTRIAARIHVVPKDQPDEMTPMRARQ